MKSFSRKDLSKALSQSGIRFGRKASKFPEDEDKSDVATRNLHKVVVRSDGRSMIRAMNSSNDVVKRFKLRSNSIVDHTGALQHEIIVIENRLLSLEAKRKGLIR